MLEDLKDEKRVVFKNLDRIVIIVAAILFVLYLFSGIYQVQANEQALVRRFGRFIKIVNPGINYRIPWPIDSVDKIKIKQVKRIEVGFWPQSGSGYTELLPYAITGDKNIIHNHYVVQYRITDPKQYLLSAELPDMIFKELANRVILEVVASQQVDPVLTTGKLQVEMDIKDALIESLEGSGLGISISSIETAMIEPPRTVTDAFKDVINAREQRTTSIHEAENYRNKVLPEANAVALNLTEQAESYKFARISAAEGESTRFLDLYEKYKTAPRVTRDRMFLEMLEQMLPNVKVVVLATDKQGRPLKVNLIQGTMPTVPQLPSSLQ